MNFLGIGPLELVFIMVIVLLVVKPEDISKIARTAGRTLNRILSSDEWSAVNRTMRDLRGLPNKLMREAQIEELEELKHDLDSTGKEIQRGSAALHSELSTTGKHDPHPGAAASSPDSPKPPPHQNTSNHQTQEQTGSAKTPDNS